MRGTKLRTGCTIRSETGATPIMEVTVTPKSLSPFFICGSGVNPMPLLSFALYVSSLYSPAYCMLSILLVLTDWESGLEQEGLGGRGRGSAASLLQKGEIICSGSFNQTMLNKQNRS